MKKLFNQFVNALKDAVKPFPIVLKNALMPLLIASKK
jgi:hypothetical protein